MTKFRLLIEQLRAAVSSGAAVVLSRIVPV
jgi:hypothetical protein